MEYQEVQCFVDSFNMDHIPVGPQAELIERIQHLNTLVPTPFKDRSDKKFPFVKFDVTKKFSWKPGTYKNARIIKDYLNCVYEGVHNYGNLKNVWRKEENNRYGYYHTRFKKELFRIDDILYNKRSTNAIWVEDSDEIEEIKNKVRTDIFDMVKEYVSYMKKIIKIPVQFHTVRGISEATELFNIIVQDTWKYDSAVANIVLVIEGQYSRIVVFQPFIDLQMNVYKVEETYPIFKYPVGKIIGSINLSLDSMIRSSLSLRKSRWDNGVSAKYWYKPLVNGLKHPFVQYPTRQYSTTEQGRSRYSDPPNKWDISFNNHGNHCQGNIDEINGRLKLINLVEWSENCYTWLTTFRTGVTHPLNSVSTGYFGHPTKIDPDVDDDYLDMYGIDRGECWDRIAQYNYNVQDRQNICKQYCIKEIQESCAGFARDVREIHIEKLVQIKKTDYALFDRECVSLPIMRIPDDAINDDYPIHVSNSQYSDNTVDDMLEWVNSYHRNN